MRRNSSPVDVINDYLGALELNPAVKASLLSDVERWVLANGEEWTVARIKTLATGFLQCIARDRWIGRSQPFLPKDAWIKTDSRGIPKGVWGHVYRLGFTNPGRAYAILTCYTAFRSKSLTERQVKKFIAGVQSSEVVVPNDLRKIVRQSARLIKKGRKAQLGRPGKWFFWNHRLGKRHPILTSGGVYKNVSEGEGILDAGNLFRDTWTGMEAIRRHGDLLISVLPDTVVGDIKVLLTEGYDGQLRPGGYVGSIGFIQEPGYKLRSVANPNRFIQLALKPLGDGIYSMLRTLPWDCTFNQGKGFSEVQERLKQDGTVHSIDLSSATDMFPLSLQEDVLRELFPRRHVELFSDMSRGTWKSRVGNIRWTKGQPLGLYPSFGAFALTHGLLLFALNGHQHNGDFYVLGDDVIILTDELASSYRKVLDVLGCEVSHSKSLSSAEIAEFGGWVITKTSRFQKLKYTPLSDDNLIARVKRVGPSMLERLPPQYIEVVRYLSSLPEELGGFGWNPRGQPLGERLDPHFHWLLAEPEDRVPHVVTLWSRVMRWYYTRSSLPLKGAGDVKTGVDLATFDQKVESEVSRILGHRLVPMSPLLGENLAVVRKDVQLPRETVHLVTHRDGGGSPTPISVWRKRLKSASR